MQLLKSELWRFPEALTQGLALGTLGVEAMSGADVCWGWRNSLGGLTALCSPGPQKARLAASPLSSRSWGQARPLPLRGGRLMLPKVESLACTPRASRRKQSNQADSSGLLVLFSISSSFCCPSFLTAGAISNQHLRLWRQNSVHWWVLQIPGLPWSMYSLPCICIISLVPL